MVLKALFLIGRLLGQILQGYSHCSFLSLVRGEQYGWLPWTWAYAWLFSSREKRTEQNKKKKKKVRKWSLSSEPRLCPFLILPEAQRLSALSHLPFLSATNHISRSSTCTCSLFQGKFYSKFTSKESNQSHSLLHIARTSLRVALIIILFY